MEVECNSKSNELTEYFFIGKMNMDVKTVLVIDDDLEVCRSFRWLFESVNLRVQIYSSAESFLNGYDLNQRACLIIDVRMPVMSGIELLEHLNLVRHKLSIIMITGYGDIQMAVRAMKAGAVDFILKPVNHQHLLEMTQRCLNNQNSVNLLEDDFCDRFETLTNRERQVMDLVVDGRLNKQIAYDLDISISTVEAHRAKVMRKMKVKTLAELVKISLIQSHL
jgi:two-component system response regulator TtrR